MSAASPDLTVVIVTHDSAGVVGETLASLASWPRAEVIVVDNASSDGTPGVVERAGVRCARNAANVGFGAACNQGARLARAPVLCFLNPDCAATPELLDRGLARVRAEPAACVVPMLHEYGRDVPGRQPGYTALKIAADVLAMGYGRPLVGWMRWLPGFHDRAWFWPHGACWFVDRARFLGVGGFDPAIFVYMEDVDFGRRWHRAGGTVVQLDCRVRHDRGHGAGITDRRRAALLVRARLDYARAHHGWWFSAVLGAAAGPGLWLRRRRRVPA